MMTQNQHYFRYATLLSALFLLSGCASINYYSQSIQGQFEVLQKRQSINEILKENNISDSLRIKLNTVLSLRDFSIQQLGLPNNNSYLSYADLERDHVIWNIFATEEFSLEPITWCYLVVGCLSYRGYFSQAEAQQHASELEKQGHDIYLGGVSAYSTLGWFDDPVLNTMLRWSDIRLATVMFHELAHQQLYIKNDTEFNEAYADAVAHIGVTRWLEQNSDKHLLNQYKQSQYQEREFIGLIMRYKSILNKIYQSDENEDITRKQKTETLQQMKNEYLKISQAWGKDPYKKWFDGDINNAKLAAIVTYRRYFPAFLDIYEKLNKDHTDFIDNLSRFYSFSKSLLNCKLMKRKEILKSRKIEFEC
jgi:predicted aminopeptidase